MEVADQNIKYSPLIDIQKFFFLLAILTPAIGIFVNYYAMWIVAFMLCLFWILFTSKEASAGLLFLWGLEFEPAPVDLAFAGSWFKRLIAGDVKWISNPALNLLLTYMLLNLFQIFYSVSLKRGIFFGFVTIYTISLAFYFASYIKNEEIWYEVKKFYLTAVYISSAVLIVMILTLFIQGNLGRPAGFFKDPNVAGAFISSGALFMMVKILFGKREEVFKHTLIFLFLFFSVVLTFSRGALLNLFSGIAFLGIISLSMRKSKRFIFVLFIVFFIALMSVPVILEIFRQSFRFRGAQWYDIYGRVMAWKAGIELFKSYPLGIGPGQFEDYSLDYQKSMGGWMLRLTPSAHNLYLRVLTENGILGFLIFILALIIPIVLGIKKTYLSSKSTEDIVWILGSLVGILVQSFVIDTLHWRHFWILFGFLFALFRIVNEKTNIQDS